TRSGVSYDGPQIPPPPSSLPPMVENKHEATKATVNPTNNGNTENVQPHAVHPKPVTSLISKPAVTPVSASRPNPQASIPYPSRRNNERNPLIRNKEKLSEMARTTLNEHCSAVLLKKLPEKLGDPGKFLIPCDFPGMAECLALADPDASINLMPYFMWKRLSLCDLTPTYLTLELANLSVTSPVGIAKDVYVKVGSFHFPTDFVVVDFDADPRVPLILGRSFLKTGKALIDVFKGELTLRVGKEAITFNLDQTSRYSANYSDMTAKRIDVIDVACEEYSQEVLNFSDTISSGNPTPFYDPIRRVNPRIHDVIKQEVIKLLEAGLIYPISDSPWVSPVHCVPKKGGFTVVENEDNGLILTRLVTRWRVCIDYRKLNEATRKDHFPLPFMDQMLERLARNQFYCFLDGFLVISKFPSIPRIRRKPHSPVPMERLLIAACLLGYATLQAHFKGVDGNFHDMIKKTMEVFMDDFSVFGNSFQSCLSYLDQMFKRCEDTNLCLN
nr:reverse transcriptase domain-containing protein [Tanacetum cinerariifolium]